MKRVVILCLAIATTLFLVVGCCFNKKKTKNSAINNPRGITAMSRIKNASGLEYIILQEGAGSCPKVGQTVTVHYTGWLDVNGEPGQKFDSSIDRGKPFSFLIGVGQVIRGWDEGVIDMKIGEKRRLFIPASLGYGAYGAGRVIPPHANLIFDVELIQVI